MYLTTSQGQVESGGWAPSSSERGYSPALEQQLEVLNGCLPQSPGSHSSLCIGPHPPFFFCNPYLLSGHVQFFYRIIIHPRAEMISLNSSISARTLPSHAWTFCFPVACFCSEYLLSQCVRIYQTQAALLWSGIVVAFGLLCDAYMQSWNSTVGISSLSN